MAKAKKLTLPREWRTFANCYGADHAYWYVPKGLAVSAKSLKPRLQVLKEFEHGKPWRECQQDYVQRLNDEDISDAAAGEDGGAPLARMLKQVFVMLGLAWVDPDDRVEMTIAGDKFLTDRDPEGVLSDQMSRYQFTNPSVKAVAHKSIKLHPIPFLGEVLRSLNGQRIDGAEYTLFASRAKSFEDVDEVIEQIEAFRDLSAEMRALVVKTCNSFKLPGYAIQHVQHHPTRPDVRAENVRAVAVAGDQRRRRTVDPQGCAQGVPPVSNQLLARRRLHRVCQREGLDRPFRRSEKDADYGYGARLLCEQAGSSPRRSRPRKRRPSRARN